MYFPSVLITVLLAASVKAAPATSNIPSNTITQLDLFQKNISLSYPSPSISFSDAQRLGTRFPPGYRPGHPWNYPIPSTTLTLSCTFTAEPIQNAHQTNLLLARLMSYYENPRKQNVPIFNDFHPAVNSKTWTEPERAETCAALEVQFHTDLLTYARFADALTGVNEVRLAYPGLNFVCEMLERMGGSQVPLGIVALFYRHVASGSGAATA